MNTAIGSHILSQILDSPLPVPFRSLRLSSKIMTSVTFGHQSNWSPGIGIQEHLGRTKISRVDCCPFLPSTHHGNHVAYCRRRTGRQLRPVFAGSIDGAMDPDDPDHRINDSESPKTENEGMNFEMLRENLERSVGTDDSRFSGIDLATLIRNKYGKSYDVQLIKKEFMGRNLLALNVMWKYREQAVSIFIDMDESGGRANEWIYK
ncbi:uncharacterized protein LOC101207332 isoform X2 [Cucumis sativus]|uniref:uncharacterized protein LOC101207332 isoform X2 n=1 Tax=Cucumis sativus TaxID=3659 RepID=UPI0012F4A90A|nr:uncharacterized protein LOC101207332 isoform X2 [Cucumis sativus]